MDVERFQSVRVGEFCEISGMPYLRPTFTYGKIRFARLWVDAAQWNSYSKKILWNSQTTAPHNSLTYKWNALTIWNVSIFAVGRSLSVIPIFKKSAIPTQLLQPYCLGLLPWSPASSLHPLHFFPPYSCAEHLYLVPRSDLGWALSMWSHFNFWLLIYKWTSRMLPELYRSVHWGKTVKASCVTCDRFERLAHDHTVLRRY